MLSASKSGQFGGYQISRSVRLRSSASAYLNRTFSTSRTSNAIATFSAWVKRGTLGAAQSIFGGYDGSSAAACQLVFDSGNVLSLDSGGSASTLLTTTQVFRDPSAWYHIVLAVDTSQATASNRVKLYINGTQVTAFSASNYPTLNQTFQFALANANNRIGSYYSGANYFDGYMTEVNFIDGQALTPSSFGQYNAYGVWTPTKYNGTYGNNGFYLNFSDNSGATATTIGKDYSGNGNNWTPNNISVTAGTTYDSMIDVPTLWGDGSTNRGNYPVLNPLNANGSVTNGNLLMTATSQWQTTASTMGFDVVANSFYCEVTGVSINNVSNGVSVGILGTAQRLSGVTNTSLTAFATGYAWQSYGGIVGNNGTPKTYNGGATYATGDVIGIAVSGGTLTFYKNGVSQGAAYTGLTGEFCFAVSAYGSDSLAINFGQRPFSYTVPSGYKALNTFNLPTPTIGNGANYMAATIWTGDATTPRTLTNTVNGVSFQPDLVWGKNRSDSNGWQVWFDSIRGGSQIASNSTDAELSSGSNVGGYVSSYNSNGFTVTRGSNANFTSFNASGNGFVAWQWQAGAGTTSSNTSGSITSTVSVNTTAGFSVVTYTATAADPITVGHGLGVAPSMFFVKSRSSAGTDWFVYHSSLGATKNLRLNTTAAAATATNVWNDTAPTSTVITTSNAINTNTQTYVAYCWAAVAGYSAFGSYTGNGSADGPFVYLGFRPRFVMIKRTDSTSNWWIENTANIGYNTTASLLSPNTSDAEYGTASYFDLLSNGFKLRQDNTSGYANASGGTYIYAAFAENPFKLALAR